MKRIDKIINFMRVLKEVCVVKRDLLPYDGTIKSNAMHISKLSFPVMLTAPHLKNKVDYTQMRHNPERVS